MKRGGNERKWRETRGLEASVKGTGVVRITK